MTERRSDVRANVHLRGFIIDGQRARVGCQIADLSVGGALIVGGPVLVHGQVVRVALELPTGPVFLCARV